MKKKEVAKKMNYSKMHKPEDWKNIEPNHPIFHPYSKKNPAPVSVRAMYGEHLRHQKENK